MQPQQAFCQCNKSLRVKWLAGRQKVQCSRARESAEEEEKDEQRGRQAGVNSRVCLLST